MPSPLPVIPLPEVSSLRTFGLGLPSAALTIPHAAPLPAQITEPRISTYEEKWTFDQYPFNAPLRQSMLERIAALRDEISKFAAPPNLPHDDDIDSIQEICWRLHGLEDGLAVYCRWGNVQPWSTSVFSEIALLNVEWLVIHAARIDLKIQGAGPAMRTLTESAGDADLIDRWRQIEREEGRKTATIDWQTTLRRRDLFVILLSDTLSALAARVGGITDDSQLPGELRELFFQTVDMLARLDIIESGFSAETVQAFAEEAVLFYASFLHGRADACARFFYPFMNRHLLLESRPSADGLLKSLTWNLKGYRRVFPTCAGDLWLRNARFTQELTRADGTSTGFFLSLERGIMECESGLGLYLYEGDPAGVGPYGAAARLGLFFGEDDSMRIVNFQTAIPNYAHDEATLAEQRERLKAALGGLTSLDALVAAAIHWAHFSGFRRIEGIRDEAQQPLHDAIVEGKRQPLYSPTFARFGFTPPGESDAWSLDLRTFSLFDPEGASEANHPMEYFWKVLARRNPGNRIKYADWRKQKPNPASPKFLAFLDTLMAAMSELYLKAIPSEELAPYLQNV